MRSILIVDDHRLVRGLLAEYFTRAGYRVSCAADGREALEHVRRRTTDVMLLDLHMPGVHGLETLRRIRNQFPSLKTRIILMSGAYPGLDTDEIEDVSMLVGAHATAYKPFDLNQLLTMVREQEGLLPYTSRDTFYAPARSAPPA